MRRVVTISMGLLLSMLLGACGAAATTPAATTTGGSTAPTSAAGASAPTTAATTAADTSAPTTAATTAANTSATTAPTAGAAMSATGEATSGTSATTAPTGEAAMSATGEATSGTSTSATTAPTGDAAMSATGEATSGTTTSATTQATSGTGTSATTQATSATGGTGATEGDLLEAAMANEDLATLVTAIQAAGLEETLQGAGPFTIFAPTNEAFAALPAGVLENLIANPEILATILTYHVAEGSMMASDLAAGESITTVEGQAITVSAAGSDLQLNNQAKFITTDIETDNGVIHIIDTVLLPPGVALP